MEMEEEEEEREEHCLQRQSQSQSSVSVKTLSSWILGFNVRTSFFVRVSSSSSSLSNLGFLFI